LIQALLPKDRFMSSPPETPVGACANDQQDQVGQFKSDAFIFDDMWVAM